MRKKPIGQWSMQFDHCQTCNTKTSPYMAGGLCRRCYLRKYTATRQNKMAEYKRKWYAKSGGKEWARLQREQRHFGGLREKVLQRDGYKCTDCNSVEQLLVHHKDGKGRGCKTPNNSLENLVTLCRACHIKHHRKELRAALLDSHRDWWCRKWKLKACRECGRSEIKHDSNGFCGTCMARIRNKGSQVCPVTHHEPRQ